MSINNQRSGTTGANKWYKGFQSGLLPKHMYIWFYMVVGKWFAPCGKCEEDWGHGAWVIGQLSLKGDGSPAFERRTQTFVYFTDRGAERHKKGKMVGRNVRLYISVLQVMVLIKYSCNLRVCLTDYRMLQDFLWRFLLNLHSVWKKR